MARKISSRMTADRADAFVSCFLAFIGAKEAHAFNNPCEGFIAVFASAVSDVFNDSPAIGIILVRLLGAVLFKHRED